MGTLNMLNGWVGAAGTNTLAAGIGDVMPPAASTVADEVDYAMDFINGVSAFFFVLIIGLMVFFAIRYRRRDPRQRAVSQYSHNTPLELAWSLPPLVIVLYMFWLGLASFLQITTIPLNAYEIQVNAAKWDWQFTYPNGRVDSNLHVPAGEPVRLVMSSSDVLHSLYIPAFRVKRDVVPGRYHKMWFEAIEPTEGADFEAPEGVQLDRMVREVIVPQVRSDLASKAREAGRPAPSDQQVQAVAAARLNGLTPEEKQKIVEQRLMQASVANGFDLYCAEYCGTNHSLMSAKVVVHEPGWRPGNLFEQGEVSAERGAHIFQTRQCAGCHQVSEDQQLPPTAPSFVGGIFSEQEQLAGGQTVTVDENYLRTSIVNPQEHIVQGFAPIMPLVELSEEEVNSLVLYLKSLGGEQQ